MRYSAILASALAGSAAAMPYLEERALVTRLHTETAIETVVVFVTVTRARSSSSFGQQPSGSAAPIGVTLTSSTSSSAMSSATSRAMSSATSRAMSSATSRAMSSATSRAASSSARVSSASSAASIATIVGSPTMTSSPAAVRSSTQAASSSNRAASSSTRAAASSTRAASSSASPSSTAPSQVGPSHLSGPQQAFLSSGADYQNAVLYHHNAARANHRAAPLTWSTECEQNARLAAQTCNFAHYVPDGVRNGQNLFTVSGSAFNVTAGITESWYKGELPYMTGNFGLASLSDTVFHQVGHLTQLLWQDTTSVGCVSIDCGDNMKVGGASSDLNKFTVCNYAPPGNIVGQYGAKVQPPIANANLGSWSD